MSENTKIAEQDLIPENEIKEARIQKNDKKLRDNLNKIKEVLSDKINPPSAEEIESAYKFLNALKNLREGLDIARNQTKEWTKLDVDYLKKETEIFEETKKLLETNLNPIKLNDNKFLDKEDSNWMQQYIHFYLIRHSNGTFTLDWRIDWKTVTKKSFVNIDDLDKAVEELSNSEYNENKDLGSTKINAVWENFIKKVNKITDEELKLTNEEKIATKEILWIELSNNIISALSVWLKSKNEDLSTKENWEKAWYEYSGMHFSDSELNELNELLARIKYEPWFEAKAKWLLEYYKKDKTSIDYLRDTKSVKKLQEKTTNIDDKKYAILNVIWNTEWEDLKLPWDSLFYILNKFKKEPLMYKAITRLLNEGGRKVDIKNIDDLNREFSKDPSLKHVLIRSINLVDWDMGSYFSSWWPDKRIEQETRVIKELSKWLEEKFIRSIPELKSKLRDQITKEVNPDKKKTMEETLKQLETKWWEQEFLNFLTLRSVNFVWSAIKWKEWGWMGLSLGLNSTNAILQKISLDIGFVVWWNKTFIPSVALSIWDTFASEKTGTEATLQTWVGIYWVYAFGSLAQQINSSGIESASFEDFKWSAKKIWVYANGWVWFMWWITHGEWITYTDSMKEAIDQKEKQLDKLLSKLDWLDKLEDIDKLDLEESAWGDDNTSKKSEEKENYKKLKEDLKDILKRNGFENGQNKTTKDVIIEKVKWIKKNMFRKIASQNAAKKWWELSGLLAWVQFLWGFFPIIVAWFSLEKISSKQVANEDKKIMDKIIQDNNYDKKTPENVVQDLKKELWINIKFEKWVFEIDWFELNAGWAGIIKSNGKEIAVYFKDPTKIKINWSKLITSSTMIKWLDEVQGDIHKLSLTLDWWNTLITSQDVEKLSKNNLTPIEIRTNKTSKWENMEISKKEHELSNFIERHLTEFNDGLWSGKKWTCYNEFKDELKNWKILSAKTKMIEYLKLCNLSWTKDAISKLENIKDLTKIALILADFKDALMSDNYTLDRVNKVRVTKKWEKSNYDLATEKTASWFSRKEAFQKYIATQLWSNSSVVNQAMEKRIERDKHQSWWTVDKNAGKDIFWLVASYKISGNWESKWRWFDTMPPGTISVADWVVEEIKPTNKSEMYDKIFKWWVYLEYIKWVILKNIQKTDPSIKTISDGDFKKMVLNEQVNLNWKNYSLPDAKFVFFMYGRCYNESVWVKFWKLSVDGKDTWKWDIDFSAWTFVDETKTEIETSKVSILGAWWQGSKDEPKKTNKDEVETKPDTTEIKDEVSTTPDTTNIQSTQPKPVPPSITSGPIQEQNKTNIINWSTNLDFNSSNSQSWGFWSNTNSPPSNLPQNNQVTNWSTSTNTQVNKPSAWNFD